jgi:hypothetical protein
MAQGVTAAAPATAGVLPFPRIAYIVDDHICRQPGPEGHLMCFAAVGHDGEHSWSDWRGCRMRIAHQDTSAWSPRRLIQTTRFKKVM